MAAESSQAFRMSLRSDHRDLPAWASRLLSRPPCRAQSAQHRPRDEVIERLSPRRALARIFHGRHPQMVAAVVFDEEMPLASLRGATLLSRFSALARQ